MVTNLSAEDTDEDEPNADHSVRSHAGVTKSKKLKIKAETSRRLKCYYYADMREMNRTKKTIASNCKKIYDRATNRP